jgi:hypothetical protein
MEPVTTTGLVRRGRGLEGGTGTDREHHSGANAPRERLSMTPTSRAQRIEGAGMEASGGEGERWGRPFFPRMVGSKGNSDAFSSSEY